VVSSSGRTGGVGQNPTTTLAIGADRIDDTQTPG
jgi:hypothetical protein